MKIMATIHETSSAIATTAKRVKQYSPAPLLAKPTGRNPVTVTSVPVGISHADRHTGDRYRISSGRLCQKWCGRILFHPLRRGCNSAAGLVDRSHYLHPLPRQSASEGTTCTGGTPSGEPNDSSVPQATGVGAS